MFARINFFALLVLFSAFLIESIGTYVSVVGLSSLFASNVVIITLAVALDLGKVVAVSFLFNYWKYVNFVMRSYMTAAVLVLMTITSAGAFGYLSAEFQKAISGTQEQTIMVDSLTAEQSRLQKRKEEIDKQIAQLPENNVRGRSALIKNFGPEIQGINARLVAIDTELPKLKVESIKKNVEVGPIIYIAQAFNTTPEQAVKWIIFVIMAVFDPLAISLLLAGNFLLAYHKNKYLESLNTPKPRGYEFGDEDDITVVRASEAYAKPPEAEEPLPEVIEQTIDELEESFVPHVTEAQENHPATLIAPVPEEIELEAEDVKEVVQVEEPVVVDPEPETTPEATPEVVEQVDESQREVITIEQITKPVKPTVEEVLTEPQPIHRSMLEDIDARKGDIQEGDVGDGVKLRKILNQYVDLDTPPEVDKGPAVFVGGPSGKPVKR